MTGLTCESLNVNCFVMKRIVVFLCALSIYAFSFSQCGSDCVPCSEGMPCCTVYNACNAYETFCFDCDTYYGTNGVGCDLSCAPIDSGVLFLLLGGAAFGGLMLVRNRRHELTLVQERS